MPTDLEIIKELEKEIGIKLKEEDVIDYHMVYDGAYQVDTNDYVKRLALEGIGLNHVPSNIFYLKHLEYLSMFSNSFKEIPSKFNQLTNLTMLDLNANMLTRLPSEIAQLKNLLLLDLGNNEITSFPPAIAHLTNITDLVLNANDLTSIPPEITKLTNLRNLNLAANNLTSLPFEIKQLKNLKSLNLDANPITQPPPEIVFDENNIERIRDYFAELEEQGEAFIYEAKLTLVGEPGAGKTSLRKKFLNPKYKLKKQEKMTKGIDVDIWPFPYSKDTDFQCNIWDFGGQDIMHATHRYFLTKRTLYILVADNRKEDTDFYYWLNILNLLAGDSPVIIVNNEKYSYKKFVPENIVDSFSSIKEISDVNLATNKGLSDLSSTVQQYLRDLPHVGKNPIPKKWVQIRKDLESIKKDYISLDDYLEICDNYEIVDKQKALYISEFLHDLGSLLHFQSDALLKNTLILNTKWATEAVYLVLLDNTVIGNGGKFDHNDLESIWADKQYHGKHGELLQLMVNFELCYEIENTKSYIIPELLPDKPTSDKEFWGNAHLKEEGLIHFEYGYDFMPKGIISRLIVRMNDSIHQNQQWKSGVVLKIGESCAEIIEYWDNRKLKIRVAGADRLYALTLIRSKIDELHKSFEKLIPHEMVPCICIECEKQAEPSFFEFDELKQYKQEGQQFIKCRVGRIKDVDVLTLISDVTLNDGAEMGKGREEKIIINVKGGDATASSHSESKADVDVTTTVDIDITVELPHMQNDFAELKEIIAEEDPKLEKELDRIEDSLDCINSTSDQKEFTKPMNKLSRFLAKLNDEDSKLYKAVQGTKKGIELAQKVGKTYNKIGQWMGLPQVPDVFLGE